MCYSAQYVEQILRFNMVVIACLPQVVISVETLLTPNKVH